MQSTACGGQQMVGFMIFLEYRRFAMKANSADATKLVNADFAAKRNGLIELCRFIFSLCVVSHHAQFLVDPGYIPVIGGYISVEFFFILTGYFLFASVQKAGAEDADSQNSAIHAVMKRVKKFYPYFFVTWFVSFTISHILNNTTQIKTFLWDLMRGIPQLLLLSMAGLAGSSEGLWDYVGTGWYVSAMVLSILIIYPMMRKGKTFFSAGIAPAIALLGYGFIVFKYNFLGVVNQRSSFIYDGLVRAVAGMCLGSFCYYIVQWLPKREFTKFGKAAASFIQIGTITAVLYFMDRYTGYNDVIQVFLFSILIIVSFAGESYINQVCNLNVCYSLGKFSTVIYLTQCLAYTFPDLLPYPAQWRWRYVVYFGYVLLFSLANFALVSRLKRLAGRIDLKRLLWEECGNSDDLLFLNRLSTIKKRVRRYSKGVAMKMKVSDEALAERQMKKRNHYFDAVKAVLILLVVCAHAIEIGLRGTDGGQAVYFFLELFLMPVFLFVQGYFSKSTAASDQKILGNILLYFALFCVAKAFYYGGFYMIDGCLPSWTGETFWHEGSAPWYMLSSVFFTGSLWLARKVKGKPMLIFCSVVGIAAGCFPQIGTWLSLSRTFVFMPFYLAGYYFPKLWAEKLTSWKKRMGRKLTGGAIAGLSVIIYVIRLMLARAPMLNNVGISLLWGHTGYAAMGLSMPQGCFWRIVCYLISTCLGGVFLLAVPVESRYAKLNRIAGQVGSNTLPVYLLHYPVLLLLWRKVFPPYMPILLLILVCVVLTLVLSSPVLSKPISWLRTRSLEMGNLTVGCLKNLGQDALNDDKGECYTTKHLTEAEEKMENISLLICTSLCLTSVFFLFGSLQLYLGNISELWFSIIDLFIPSILVCLFACILLVSIGILIIKKKKLFHVYISLLWGLSIALYIQGNFMRNDYGQLNGLEIDWSSYSSKAAANMLFWIVCLIIPFFIQRVWKKSGKTAMKYLVCGIILVQLITVVTLCVTSDLSKTAGHEYNLTNEGLYDISSDENVIVFVLDTFDQDYFNEVYAEDKAYVDFFDGFTYFSNMAGTYTFTAGAISYMLTGQYFENLQPYSEYVTDAWEKNADYYQTLQSNGFDVGIYTTTEMSVSNEAKFKWFSNITNDGFRVSSHMGMESAMIRFCAMNFFPDAAKKYVWVYDFDNLFDRFKLSKN